MVSGSQVTVANTTHLDLLSNLTHDPMIHDPLSALI